MEAKKNPYSNHIDTTNNGARILSSLQESAQSAAWDEGKQAGMQEVVDWVNKHREGITAYGVYIPEIEWQDYLKEKG